MHVFIVILRNTCHVLQLHSKIILVLGLPDLALNLEKAVEVVVIPIHSESTVLLECLLFLEQSIELCLVWGLHALPLLVFNLGGVRGEHDVVS